MSEQRLLGPAPPAPCALPWVGVVLAGGKSTRMGRDKAALEIEGESLLTRQKKLLQAASCAEVWVIGAHDSDWPLHDRVPAAGPMGGILRALEEAQDRFAAPVVVMVVPVDMPALTPALLRTLQMEMGDAAVAHFHSGPLPCLLRADAALHALLRARMAEQRRDLRSAFALAGARVCRDPTDEDTLINVNTPAEFAAFLESRS